MLHSTPLLDWLDSTLLAASCKQLRNRGNTPPAKLTREGPRPGGRTTGACRGGAPPPGHGAVCSSLLKAAALGGLRAAEAAGPAPLLALQQPWRSDWGREKRHLPQSAVIGLNKGEEEAEGEGGGEAGGEGVGELVGEKEGMVREGGTVYLTQIPRHCCTNVMQQISTDSQGLSAISRGDVSL